MRTGADIVNINLSWLSYMSQALDTAGIKYIYQTCDLRAPAGDVLEDLPEFVILSPLNQWGVTADGMGVMANLRLAVVVDQNPGDILKAFSRNLAIQMVIEQALYGSERLLETSMGAQEFAIPLHAFDDNGDPTAQLDAEGIRYERGLWNDGTPDAELRQAWTTSLQASIY